MDITCLRSHELKLVCLVNAYVWPRAGELRVSIRPFGSVGVLGENELTRQGWAKVIGAAQLQRMRRDLVRVLSDARSGELPPVRPIW